jgi:hypothetical protein
VEDRPGERLQRYHELVCSDLGRLGGTVVKFVGDAVMVLPLVGNERRQPTKMYVRHPNCRTRIAPRKETGRRPTGTASLQSDRQILLSRRSVLSEAGDPSQQYTSSGLIPCRNTQPDGGRGGCLMGRPPDTAPTALRRD